VQDMRCDIINYYVWRCDVDKISIFDKILTESLIKHNSSLSWRKFHSLSALSCN